MSSDVVRAISPVVGALEGLGIAYRIGGSVASSALGVPRSTLDIDIVCDIESQHVDAFAAGLGGDYYVDADMIREAIAQRSSFNVIFVPTMTKVDVFVKRGGIFDREVFRRVVHIPLEEGSREFDVTTAEDIVLRKLEWFKLGGGVSERQWLDVVGVLRVQMDQIDGDYLRKWADTLDVLPLLLKAMGEAQ